jgi:hypothetical protein
VSHRVPLELCDDAPGRLVRSPRFVAQGTQAVFGVHAPGDLYGEMWRVNLEAVIAGASQCPATRIVDTAAVAGAIGAVRPDVTTGGIALAASATSFDTPSCAASGVPVWAVLAALMWRRRRRSP